MDAANSDEALKEMKLDIKEEADIIITYWDDSATLWLNE